MIPTAPPAYRADIDGLRAVAILLVTVFHFDLFHLGEGGFIGVDVFFVISGYLITTILMRDLAAGEMRFGRFYAARLRRLMPALLATLALYLLAGAALMLPGTFEELAVETVWSLFYVVNFYFWQEISYFGLSGATTPLLHMWSLAIEEQFYIFYPAILLISVRLAGARVAGLLLAGLLASFLLSLWVTSKDPQAAFYLLPTRGWELLAGGVLAVVRQGRPLDGRAGTVAGGIGVALIAVALATHSRVTPFPGWFALYPVLAALCLILAGPASLTGRLLSLRPLVWIGRISYPLYLVHWPVIILYRDVTADPKSGPGWLGFAVSILLAWTIWALVETPIRRRRVLAGTPGMLAATAAAVAVIAVAAAGIWRLDGVDARFSGEARYILSLEDDIAAEFDPCEWRPGRSLWRDCRLGQPDTPPRIAVIGDSHAWALSPALDLWLSRSGEAGTLYFRRACMPALGSGRPACRDFLEDALDALAGETSVERVLLISAWGPDPGVYGTDLIEDAAGREAAFDAALGETLDRLDALGVEAVLVDPLFRPVGHAVHRAARGLDIDPPLAAHRAAFAPLDRVFTRAVAAGRAERVSLIDGLCAGSTCRAAIDRVPLFKDTNHLRAGSAGLFAEILGDVLN